ncbi:hypothetical protein C0Q70_19872 [Pomacea canaliculata]|uniref:Uncharacterized protein n=1 Tax=Pomacea canaliculata TaxID=400727 RepID=A0A2T7NDY3_POMCA|nr:hypothetical protein C0Q70_19872 [Pomacea canaliculata]
MLQMVTEKLATGKMHGHVEVTVNSDLIICNDGRVVVGDGCSCAQLPISKKTNLGQSFRSICRCSGTCEICSNCILLLFLSRACLYFLCSQHTCS